MRRPYLSTALKKVVKQRAGDCCEYCKSQAAFSTQSFSIEHIIPLSKEGTNNPDNLALACQGCNGHKYNKTAGVDPASGNPAPIFHPREQSWEDHFSWNEDFTEIIGLDASGRATVSLLRLNRQGLVNLRRVLFQLGEHPP